MTRKAAAKNSRLLGEKKARVLVEFVLIIYRVLLFLYLSLDIYAHKFSSSEVRVRSPFF